MARKKHKEHWIPFDRNKPPPWMDMGPVGIDDKRASPPQALLILQLMCTLNLSIRS